MCNESFNLVPMVQIAMMLLKFSTQYNLNPIINGSYNGKNELHCGDVVPRKDGVWLHSGVKNVKYDCSYLLR